MRYTKIIFFAVVYLSLTNPAQANPLVAVSIKPIHSLVASIMAGVGEPALIIKGSRSPHSYSLKPSDARTLSQAKVVIWMGPDIEMFLQKSITALSTQSEVITLLDGEYEDPHLWLSPKLAETMVKKIALALSKIDPVNADKYKTNATTLKDRLQALQAYGMERLTKFSQRPFLVFHDAWSHFAESFALSISGTVALSPERPAGAKKVSAMRSLIKASKAHCLFGEPQFQSPLLLSILEGQDGIQVFELDPLGVANKPGPDLYFQMMETNINAVASCLN